MVIVIAMRKLTTTTKIILGNGPIQRPSLLLTHAHMIMTTSDDGDDDDGNYGDDDSDSDDLRQPSLWPILLTCPSTAASSLMMTTTTTMKMMMMTMTIMMEIMMMMISGNWPCKWNCWPIPLLWHPHHLHSGEPAACYPPSMINSPQWKENMSEWEMEGDTYHWALVFSMSALPFSFLFLFLTQRSPGT